MKYARLFTWLLPILLVIAPLSASPGATETVCSDLVAEALAATNRVCEGAGRNSACYGHPELSVQPQSGIEALDFDNVGDVVSVSEVNSLRLSALDLPSELWGVALLKLQANIPDENPENLSLLLFGDVQVRNLIETPVILSGTLNSDGNANVRREPSNRGFVLGTIPDNSELVLRGRSLDDNWIYIDLPGSANQRGWIARNLVRSEEDLSQLRLVRPGMTQYGPMQAFYLRTGARHSTCAEASNDGVLIQTPEGVAEVRLWINEVKIRLGSTAFIQAYSESGMVIKALEGATRVEALGIEQVAVRGESITVPLNESLLPAAPPAPAQPYQNSDVNALPIGALDRPITLVPTSTATVPHTEQPSMTFTPPVEQTAIPSATSTPEPPTTEPFTLVPTRSATPDVTLTTTDTAEPTNPPNTWTPLSPTETVLPPTGVPEVTETPTSTEGSSGFGDVPPASPETTPPDQ